jgi:hypothetical protein
MLKQFDIITAPAGQSFPYMVVLQSDMLQDLATRIACPMVDATQVPSPSLLWPKVALNNTQYVVLVPRMLSISADQNATAIANLGALGDALQQAINMVFLPPE